MQGKGVTNALGKKLIFNIDQAETTTAEYSAEKEVPADEFEKWELFSSQKGGFHVRFPGKPEYAAKVGADTIRHTFSVSLLDGQSYSVSYLEWRWPHQNPFARFDFETVVGEHIKELRGKHAIRLARFQGLEMNLEPEVAGKLLAQMTRVYNVNDTRIYELTASGMRDSKDVYLMARFLDSFGLGREEDVAVKPPVVPAKPVVGVNAKAQEEMREAAVAWFKENNAQGPMNPFVNEVKGHWRRALASSKALR
jgi:hypothetical protein